MIRVVAAAFILALMMAGQALAKPGDWVRAESPNFVVYCRCNEPRALQNIRELEAFHGLLVRILEPVIFRWKHSLHFAGSWSIPAR
jgi:hypothetical protein